MKRALILLELWICVAVVLACVVVSRHRPEAFEGRVVHAEHALSISGAAVARLWIEWDCGMFCHESFEGEFPIPSREAALGVEGRCVMVRVEPGGLLSLDPCP